MSIEALGEVCTEDRYIVYMYLTLVGGLSAKIAAISCGGNAIVALAAMARRNVRDALAVSASSK